MVFYARLVVAAVLLLTVAPASAQDAEIETEAATDSGAEASADDRARVRYQQGEVAYGEGRFSDALRLFAEAQELSGRPELLYNMGMAAMNGGEDERALEAFRRYLELVPEASNRALVEGRIGSLAREVADNEAAAARTRDVAALEMRAADEERERTETMRTVGWIGVASGAVLLVGGGVALLLGAMDVAKVEDAAVGTPWVDLRAANDRAPVLTGLGIGCMALGAVAAVLGLTFVLTNPSSDRTAPTARVTVGPTGIAIGGRL